MIGWRRRSVVGGGPHKTLTRSLDRGNVNGRGHAAVALGASVILYLPERPAILALGLLTLGLGLYSMFKPRLGLDYAPRNRDGGGLLVGLAGLFAVGFLNGSITSGSGLFLTVWLVRHFGLDYKRAVAYTMVLGGVLWNGTGAAVLGLLGEVRWSWMPVLLAGAVIGGYLGSHVAIVKGNLWVKRAFEITTVLIGVKLIVG